MSQTDSFYIPNLAGAPFRNLLNQILEALSKQNAGSTEPPNPFSGMVWLDTSSDPAVFKQRNEGNTGWIKIFTADNPPTKAQVGLSNVPNYSATSSLTDGSNSKFLLAAAGKNLQDNKVDKRGVAYDSARLGNKLASQYVLISGTYPNLRAQATTKADVDLGNVQNYGLTSSLTSNNASQYLSAKGGYDLNQMKVNKTVTINGKPLRSNISLSAANVGALPAGGGDLSGPINYTPDTGDIIKLDGKVVLRRISANGVSFGAGDAVIIGSGESRNTLQSNVSVIAEEIHIGSDGAIKLYTNLQSGWASRKVFQFENDGGFLPGNIEKTRQNLDVARQAAGRVVGEIARFSFEKPPPGFFALDGSRVPNGAKDYPALVASGSRFITVSGNDIILANYQDFGRGKGSSNRPVGSFQSDAMRDIKGRIDSVFANTDGSNAVSPVTSTSIVDGIFKIGSKTGFQYRPGGSTNQGSLGRKLEIDFGKVVSVSDQFQPKSLTELVCIYHGVF